MHKTLSCSLLNLLFELFSYVPAPRLCVLKLVSIVIEKLFWVCLVQHES